MIRLPEAFKNKMERLLKEEYAAFLESYESERMQGLRYNPLKSGSRECLEGLPFHLRKIPWAREGYYYGSCARPGKHPLHEAGLYYIQEPSAMAAAELLGPVPGDSVLDLCGAPGGKTTQIAGRLMGQGLLLTNEIHPARAKILSQNVERMGIRNAVVTNETPSRLSDRFPDFFDKIMVDAPCSGEGMFRKDQEARTQWSLEHVTACAARQLEILKCAAQMVKPGGRIVYSTCTFSPEEDERVVEAFLIERPDFEMEAIPIPGLSPGRPEWTKTGMAALSSAYRIWPHRTEGEGHFLAALKRKGGRPLASKGKSCEGREQAAGKEYERFCIETLTIPRTFLGTANILRFGDHLYRYPAEMPDPAGLKLLRPGLHLGTLKKNRFEPSHGLALSMSKDDALLWLSYEAESREAAAYLRGETLPIPKDHPLFPANQKGWVLMTVDGWPVGWAKAAGGSLKNHYPKGLRRL